MERVDRVLALCNDVAGGGRQPAAQTQALAELRRAAEVEVVHASGASALEQVVHRLDGRRLVVFGGDGSVQALAQALHSCGALREVGPVSLVPMGTGNDLARSLGLPLDDPTGAARIALTGEARDLELLLDDADHVVVNAVHVGVGAEAGARASVAKGPLHRVGLGRAAYPLGALAAGATSSGWSLRVTLDGRMLDDGSLRTLLVAIAIGTSVGGGAALSPQADPFDGELDVTVSTATGPLARVAYAASVSSGAHVDRADTLTGRGLEVTIESVDGKPFRCNADGEVSEPLTRRSWHVVPCAWQMVTGAGRAEPQRTRQP